MCVSIVCVLCVVYGVFILVCVLCVCDSHILVCCVCGGNTLFTSILLVDADPSSYRYAKRQPFNRVLVTDRRLDASVVAA